MVCGFLQTASANTVTSVIRDVDTSGRTTITVICAEPVDPGSFRSFPVPDPPRAVVVLEGIDAPFKPDFLAINDRYVQQVRLGYHPDRPTPELHVILDLNSDDIEVLDLRSLNPLDTGAILASVEKTGKVLIAHEATRSCGVGAEVASLVSEQAFESLDAPVRRLTAPDVPIPFSPPLAAAVLPQLDDMKEAARELLAY